MQSPSSVLTPYPDLKCCQHCDRNTNILCCTVPPVCPICRCDTSIIPLRIPPYVLPPPFSTSSLAPCSIVLKPTLGDFIRNYNHMADLHIGVTDSKGCCYDFDEDGLHIGGVWQQCIAITMVTGETVTARESLTSNWDLSLTTFADPRAWTAQRLYIQNTSKPFVEMNYCRLILNVLRPLRYHERDCNCFDFVLQFLWTVGLQSRLGGVFLGDKQVFCNEFLQQQTKVASQYVSLYRKVLKEGYVLDHIKAS